MDLGWSIVVDNTNFSNAHPPGTSSQVQQISNFFDKFVNSYYDEKMIKYIRMDTFRDDFIGGVLQAIADFRRTDIKTLPERDDNLIEKIPYWFGAHGGLDAHEKIKNFVYQMDGQLKKGEEESDEDDE